MVAFVKYDSFVLELGSGGHNLTTGVLKVALTNTAPSAAHTTWSTGTYPEPAAAGGYTTGGITVTGLTYTQTSGLGKLVTTFNPVWTANATTIGPFRYVILYNSSATNKLIGNYDYGSSITLANTETFTVDFDDTNGVLTIQ